MTYTSAQQVKERYPYLYETHMHTSQGSKCGLRTGAQMARACREYGYSGIFITDHNWGGNTAVDRSLPWTEWVELFSAGYRDAKAAGDQIGLDVFYGWEAGYNGTEFLIYGITPEQQKMLPELWDASPAEEYEIIHRAGGLVVQAHPFREAGYIPCIRLYPNAVDAVEGINATHTNPLSKGNKNKFYDPQAMCYAKAHGLSITAGSDIHDTVIFGGGVAFTRKLQSAKDYVDAIRGDEDYAVTDGVSWYDRYGNPLYIGEYPDEK